jgi:hypothetical protein
MAFLQSNDTMVLILHNRSHTLFSAPLGAPSKNRWLCQLSGLFSAYPSFGVNRSRWIASGPRPREADFALLGESRERRESPAAC